MTPDAPSAGATVPRRDSVTLRASLSGAACVRLNDPFACPRWAASSIDTEPPRSMFVAS